ncbi:hypothetical protein [Candidatus Sororendozoicomonas aggregata]|uniref:hypothetical protein n=1 Tax=Candidatus Sororendozoicomonas aggregata TaxID=3073239 RepID=UPI002ECFBB52
MISLFGVKLGLVISILTSVFSVVLLKCIEYQQVPREVKAQSLIAMHRKRWADFLKIWPEVTFAVVRALLNGVMYAFFSVFVPFFANTITADGAWIMGTLDGAFSIGLFLGATFIVGKHKLKSRPMSRAMMGFTGLRRASYLSLS